MDDIAIRIENLSKVYKLYDKPVDRLKESLNPFRRKYHKDFYALKNISFEIKKGETIGIVGKNGSGKSTLLKIITGVLTQTTGNVQVNGKISALLELGAGFNPELTGIENVYLNGMIMGYTKEEIDAKMKDILEFADIGDFVYQPVKTYSSGMFVRLAFAVAISVDPEILIVDEALSVGDISFQKKCMEKIDSIQNSGITIIFCSHDMHAISQLCKRSLWIKDGEIVQDGVPKYVLSSYVSWITEAKDTINKTTGTLINENPNFCKRNSEEVEISSVECYDTTGHIKRVFFTGDDIVFKISYIALNGILEPCYSILILRENAEPVALDKSNYHSIDKGEYVKGKKDIKVVFKNIQFNTGKYYFGISVWDKSAKINFALDRTIEIEIKSLKIAYGPMEQRTVFFPETEWEI
jgi:ABC-type polysaccharide/polyol phosphate transport system ATPase subunit